MIVKLASKRKGLKAIIVKGNPLYTNNDVARKYYEDIGSFLKANGVSNVQYDHGNPYTTPSESADMYIGHSRGAGRKEYMSPEKQKVFLKFGVPDGIIHPVDAKWQKEVWTEGTKEQPPKEHFMLMDSQKEAIVNLINKV